MTHEYPANVALLRHLTVLVQDLSDLVDREIRLAKSEIAAKVTKLVGAGILFGLAAVTGLLCFIMVLCAIVFGINAAGIALYWSFLIVAGGLAVIAIAMLVFARLAIPSGLAPDRSIEQMRKMAEDAKEQLQ